MDDVNDLKPTRKSSTGNKPKAPAKRKGTALTMANARKLGATVLNTAVSLAAAPGDSGGRQGAASRMDINAPDVVAMVLGWLTDRKQIIVIRDSSGKPVAGVVTYSWLKRHMNETDRRHVEASNAATKKAAPKRATSPTKSTTAKPRTKAKSAPAKKKPTPKR